MGEFTAIDGSKAQPLHLIGSLGRKADCCSMLLQGSRSWPLHMEMLDRLNEFPFSGAIGENIWGGGDVLMHSLVLEHYSNLFRRALKRFDVELLHNCFNHAQQPIGRNTYAKKSD